MENDSKFIIEKTEQSKNLQVIIMDQARMNEKWFEDGEVKDWGDGLIPLEWLHPD